VRFGQIRIQSQRLFELGNSVIQASRRIQKGIAEIVVRFGIIRLQANRLPELAIASFQRPGIFSRALPMLLCAPA